MFALCVIDFGDKIGMHMSSNSHPMIMVMFFQVEFFLYQCSKIAFHAVKRN